MIRIEEVSVDSALETEADLLQALDLPVDEAARAFERHLDDKSWLHVPSIWVGRLSVLAYRDRDRESGPVQRVLLKAVDAQLDRSLAPA
jgi:hypothetical protein